MGREVWGGLMEIALALIALSFFTLVIGRSRDTAQVVRASGETLGSLLNVVTLQSSGMGPMISGYSTYNPGLVW